MTQKIAFVMHNIMYASIGIIIGILAAGFGIKFGLIQIAGLALFAYSALTSKNHTQMLITIFLTAMLSGGFLYQNQMKTFEQRGAFYQNNTVDVIAQIDNSTQSANKRCLWLTTQHVRCNTNQPWQPSHDVILLCTNKAPDIDVGDTVLIQSIICAHHNQLQISKYGLVGTAFFASSIALQYRPWLSLGRWFTHKRNEIWHTLQTKLSPQTFHLFSTIFLGKNINDATQEQLRTHFVRWGLAHYLARSGIHLIMILLLLNALLRLLFIPYYLRAIIVALFCTLYALLSWPSIPFIRAFFAILVYQLCHTLKVPIDSLHILHLTLLYCLITNPVSLFFLDFQLTFALTYTLIIAMRYR